MRSKEGKSRLNACRQAACEFLENHAQNEQNTLRNANLTNYNTPWNRVLSEKLTGSRIVEKFPEFYDTREFIVSVIRALHLSLS
jgi:hypothetical protein